MPTLDSSSDDPPLFRATVEAIRARDEPTRHRGVGYGPAGGGGHRWRDDDTGEVVVGRRHDDDLDGTPNYLDPDSPEYEGAPVERNEMGGPLLARSMVAAGVARGGLDAVTLREAMGASLPLARYQALLPAFTSALIQSGCTTVKRAAMFCAQMGHESVGLKYGEEIASGAAYEGRRDLGNTQRGDGVRFKGHGWIQVTGRHNHSEVSKWAHGKGYVPTPTYFVDHPVELASDRYVWIGPVWYWTVARPRISALCDASDLDGVTRQINGGLNGLADRRARYERCLRLGDRLLPGPVAPPEPPPARALGTELVMDPIALVGKGSRRVFFDTVGPPGRVIEAGWVSLGIDGPDGASAWVRVAPQKPGGGTGPARDLKAGALTDGSHTSGRDGMALPTGTDQAQLTWEVSAGATAYLVPAFRAAK